MSQTIWPIWKITLVLYPFGAGAAGVNVFFASLIGSWIGWPVLPTSTSILIGCVIGIPATYAFARHIHRLIYLSRQ